MPRTPRTRQRGQDVDLKRLDPSKHDLEARARYLIRHMEVDTFEDILAETVSDGVPSHRGMSATTSRRAAADFITTLRHLASILIVFESALEGLLQVKEWCFRPLLDRWGHVAAWMMYIIQTNGDRPGTRYYEVQAIMVVLRGIDSATNVDPYKDEIFGMARTADVLLAIFCLLDPSTQQYVTFHDGPFKACQIAVVFSRILDTSEAACSGVLRRLGEGSCNVRRKFFSAFKARSWQIVDDIDSTSPTIEKEPGMVWIMLLIVKNLTAKAHHEFTHHKTFQDLALVLSTISERAAGANLTGLKLWTMIADCVTALVTETAMKSGLDTTRIVRQVVEGRALRCALQCLILVDGVPDVARRVRAALRHLLAFLPLYSVYDIAIEDRHAIADLTVPDAHPNLSDETTQVQDEVRRVLVWGAMAFDDGRRAEGPTMCSNLNHAKRTTLARGSGTLKTCGGCNATYYCSEDCQRDDWDNYHSRECTGISLSSRNGLIAKPSYQRRKDLLTFLEASVNAYLPGPPEPEVEHLDSVANAKRPTDLAISLFDLSGHSGKKAGFTDRISVNSHRNVYRTHINPASDNRIEACIQDMANNPGDTLLVEGVFALNLRDVVWMFAKLRYNPNAPELRGYEVISHVFRQTRDHLMLSW